jgi:hypothetical protein
VKKPGAPDIDSAAIPSAFRRRPIERFELPVNAAFSAPKLMPGAWLDQRMFSQRSGETPPRAGLLRSMSDARPLAEECGTGRMGRENAGGIRELSP